uniref:hypothetical protein n=1 Tax=Sphingomonas bacterium TaxID=1895847 RepID=UPI002602268C|nr:hypothetical protein [Sphingomonas bacterium]
MSSTLCSFRVGNRFFVPEIGEMRRRKIDSSIVGIGATGDTLATQWVAMLFVAGPIALFRKRYWPMMPRVTATGEEAVISDYNAILASLYEVAVTRDRWPEALHAAAMLLAQSSAMGSPNIANAH